MPSYEVWTTKPQAGRINSFCDAKNEADAIKAFRQKFRLDAYEKARNVKLNIEVSKIAGKEPADSSDKPVDEIMAELRADKAKAAKEAKAAAEEFIPPTGPLSELKRFGVSDKNIVSLKTAGLTSPDDIIDYARKNQGLGKIGGITPTEAGVIATAVKAVKAAKAN